MQYLPPHILFIHSPHTKPKKPLSSICEFLQSHPKGVTSEELRKKLEHITIEDAIKEWLASLEKDETRRKYRRAMQIMFYEVEENNPLRGFIKNDCSIMELDEDWSSKGFYNAIEDLPITPNMRKLSKCAFARFCNYIRTLTLGYIDAEPVPKQQDEYKRVCEIFDETDWKSFLDTVKEPFNLIAEMIFEAARLWKYRLRINDPKNNLHSLTADQLNFSGNSISFKKEQSYHPAVGSIQLNFPKNFMKNLQNYLGKRKGLVFLSPQGKPLFAKQTQRAFEKASKALPQKITPVMLSWAGVIQSKKDRQRSCL